MIREIKFLIFTQLIGLAVKFLPKDAIETRKWLIQWPFEK